MRSFLWLCYGGRAPCAVDRWRGPFWVMLPLLFDCAALGLRLGSGAPVPGSFLGVGLLGCAVGVSGAGGVPGLPVCAPCSGVGGRLCFWGLVVVVVVWGLGLFGALWCFGGDVWGCPWSFWGVSFSWCSGLGLWGVGVGVFVVWCFLGARFPGGLGCLVFASGGLVSVSGLLSWGALVLVVFGLSLSYSRSLIHSLSLSLSLFYRRL